MIQFKDKFTQKTINELEEGDSFVFEGQIYIMTDDDPDDNHNRSRKVALLIPDGECCYFDVDVVVKACNLVVEVCGNV